MRRIHKFREYVTEDMIDISYYRNPMRSELDLLNNTLSETLKKLMMYENVREGNS